MPRGPKCCRMQPTRDLPTLLSKSWSRRLSSPRTCCWRVIRSSLRTSISSSSSRGRNLRPSTKTVRRLPFGVSWYSAASTECGAGSRSAPFNAVAKSHLKVARTTWKPFARNTTSICAYSPAVMRWRSPNSSQASGSKSRRTSPLSSSGSTRTVRSLRESLTSNQSRYSRRWHNNWRVGSNPCSPSFFHQPKPPTGTKAPDKFVVHHKYKINVIVVHRSLI